MIKSAYLTEQPLDVASLLATVGASDRGGIASFVGLVRDHHGGREVKRLEYSAYAGMAEAECAAIVAEAEIRWPVRVALAHRLGTLEVGEAAVVIAVGAPHRGEAFDACRYVIEELKRRVPIWKREWYADGSSDWVNPVAAHAVNTPEEAVLGSGVVRHG
ncbi:MAG TPA: molybdenum cofactor biosynthesis protein MoaE [Gemmatimonadales bacterium]|nr:molybdenum cofactor biosynthesis protein MoaE [Gemmatimonadales bacterium]